jgi:transcription initiation factor TFIID subunit TAF12
MGDADTTASLHLINGIINQIDKDEPISAGFVRHACSALQSRPVFAVTAGAGSAQQVQQQQQQQQQHTVLDARNRLLDAVGRLIARGPVSAGMTAAAAAAAQSHALFSRITNTTGCLCLKMLSYTDAELHVLLLKAAEWDNTGIP